MPKRPVGETLDHDAEHRAADHRGGEHQREQQGDAHVRRRSAAKRTQREEADVRADHVDVAVREVEELEDPVDHRVAERDQRVEAADGQPSDELREEVMPVVEGETEDEGH